MAKNNPESQGIKSLGLFDRILIGFIIVVVVVLGIILSQYDPDIVNLNESEGLFSINESNETSDRSNVKSIMSSGIDTHFSVDRKIEVYLNGTFCVESKDLYKCDNIDSLGEYSNIIYSPQDSYRVIFDYLSEPTTIYIIHPGYPGNPQVMMIYGNAYKLD